VVHGCPTPGERGPAIIVGHIDWKGREGVFGRLHSLKPGARVYVHTGRGTNGKPDGNDVYWGSRAYIWNNTGDTATLKNASGKTIDTCKFGSKGSSTSC
jgi:hypothetical protein